MWSPRRGSAPPRRHWRKSAALLGAGLLATGLSGCAQFGEFEAQIKRDLGESGGLLARFVGSEPEPDPEPAEVEDVRSLNAILADLQKGDYQGSERALNRYLDRHPDDMAARAVLRQLTEDPEAMLGRESHRYVVQPGDSYSALAARSLGDPGLFLILARYNDSRNPSDLRVGEVLRLPGEPRSEEPAEGDGDQPTPEGEPAMAEPPAAPVPTRRTVAALSLPEDRLSSVNEPPREDVAVAETADDSDAGPDQAERLQQEGLALFDDGRQEEALARFDAALAIEPGLEPAGSRAEELRGRLVNRHHEQAILRYRNQDLDEAIDLWDRVLSIDPDFEPARTYRARARELQRRLDSL